MRRSFPFTADEPAITLKRQPYYCEENAWHLCQESILKDRPRHVVFISNLERAVPMWNQKAGKGKPIVWDYHVVVLAESPAEIWDVDTLLGLPVGLGEYVDGSFHPKMPEPYQPLFRVVESQVLVDHFASDRSHMRRKDGSYRKPPPHWPMIGKPGVASNLMQFVDMGLPYVGEVSSLRELLNRFGVA
ncbi:MAG TPA: protein N-terminal glutamine amidohydrolase [Polyangium sp.]|nr:protein N-terminal glutamine amidohydrolase [Polyangium sp.]